MQICRKCGAKLDMDDKFCPSCGKRLDTSNRKRIFIIAGSIMGIFLIMGISLFFSTRNSKKSKEEVKVESQEVNFVDETIFDSKDETSLNEEGIELFDPFQFFEYSFEGISPEGIVRITNVQDIIPLDYVCDKEKDLKNGDTIVVSVVSPNGFSLDAYCKQEFGVKLSSTSKSIKVEGLPFYVTSARDISQNVFEDMKNESELALNEEIAITNKRIHVTSFEPRRLFVYDDGERYRSCVILLSEVGIHGDYEYDETYNDFTFFYSTAFEGVVAYPDRINYSVKHYERENGMFVYDFSSGKALKNALSFNSVKGLTFQGYSELSQGISSIVHKFEDSWEYTLKDEVDFSTGNIEKDSQNSKKVSTGNGTDNSIALAEYLYSGGRSIGYQVKDSSGNVYDKAILVGQGSDCLWLDGKFKKLKGKLCLAEGAERDVYFQISADDEENAFSDDYNTMRRIFDQDKVIFETNLSPGDTVPIEFDISSYWTVGFLGKTDITPWPNELYVMITDIELE